MFREKIPKPRIRRHSLGSYVEHIEQMNFILSKYNDNNTKQIERDKVFNKRNKRKRERIIVGMMYTWLQQRRYY